MSQVVREALLTVAVGAQIWLIVSVGWDVG